MKIIFVVVDCMRWDYMSCNGYPRPTTPNLDRIAANSCVFDRAYATINQTDQSLTSIFSGYYPLTHGMEAPAFLVPSRELASFNAWRLRYLPEMLKDMGFMTFGIDWLDHWHQRGYDWYWLRDKQKGAALLRHLAARVPRVAQFGFRLLQSLRSKGQIGLGQLWTIKPGVSAETATNRALDFLMQHDSQDVFVMLHYWDVHIPYYIKHRQFLDEMRAVALAEEEHDVRALVEGLCTSDEGRSWLLTHVVRDAKTTGDLTTQYCAALRSVDEQLGRVYQFVADKHIVDQTIFVITADHGENLFEPGHFLEHYGVRENIVHIPLIMSLPGIGPSRITRVVSHVDIVPTLTDYLKLKTNSDFDGYSLLPLITEQKAPGRKKVYFQSKLQAVDPRWGIVGDRYKYVESRNTDAPPCKYCGKRHMPPVELYDLLEDNEEENNLAQSHPDLAGQVGAQLRQMVEYLTRKNAQVPTEVCVAEDIEYTEREREELEKRFRDLGYLD